MNLIQIFCIDPVAEYSHNKKSLNIPQLDFT